jgi:DNA polymerase III epsilon subunit family exonuclease
MEAPTPAMTTLRSATPDAHPFRDVVVFDTETTGFGRQARIVEIAAVHVRDGRVIDRFETLVNPGVPIPWRASQIHGITDAMVRRARATREALEAFFAFVGGRSMVAHNASFDGPVLVGEFERWSLPRGARPLYCSMLLARRVFPRSPNHQLTTLVAYLGLEEMPPHRAMPDALTAAGVLRACVERAGDAVLGQVAPSVRL